MPSPRVVLAISGGVDSAVAAVLLQRAGLRRAGPVHAQLGRGRRRLLHGRAGLPGRAPGLRGTRHPAAPRDLRCGIPRAGVPAFPRRTRAGRTPNPDVACNREIKFGVCLEHAQPTGRRPASPPVTTPRIALRADLLRGVDAGKDQTYFLHAVPRRDAGADAVPPRRPAQGRGPPARPRAGLPVHDKRDSTGICFIGERPFARVPRDLPARARPGRSRPPTASGSARIAGSRSTRWASAGARRRRLRGAAESPGTWPPSDLPTTP